MTKPTALALLLVVLVVGCGSSADEGDSGPCTARSGTYRFSFAERSGTCGAITEQIVTLDAQPTAPLAPCTSGEIRYSADNCEVTNVNIVCPEDGIAPGATSTTNGKYNWNESGSSGSGDATIVVRDAGDLILCQSSYRISAVRL
jgi:hypothetical protein